MMMMVKKCQYVVWFAANPTLLSMWINNMNTDSLFDKTLPTSFEYITTCYIIKFIGYFDLFAIRMEISSGHTNTPINIHLEHEHNYSYGELVTYTIVSMIRSMVICIRDELDTPPHDGGTEFTPPPTPSCICKGNYTLFGQLWTY